jgi:Ca2+-binding RTX toxin-like protein
MRVPLALIVALLLPATASASTIRTDAGHAYFDGGASDRVFMLLNAGNDADFSNQTAVYFIPIAGNGHVDPTTSDANCKTTGGAKCLLVNREVDVTAGSQDDFVRVANGGSQVVFKGGGGNDRIFVDNGTRLNAFGEAGNDDLMGGNGIDALDGGPDDDLLTPVGPFDDVHGGTGFDTVRMPGGGVTVSLDDAANDGTGTSENIHSDVEKVVGGSGNDQIDGSAGANTLDGGDGNDTLTGLGGADTLTGGVGNDVIQARDGVADTVSCGTGDDRAVVDPADQVSPDCETVEYADSDHDGVDVRTDCNDANPAIHPGANDVPGNGVDEDCSGADAPVNNGGGGGGGGGGTVTDADHDGASPPLDCDDANAIRHPGATDVPGNGIDEDCSGADAAVPPVPHHVTHRWDLAGTWSRVVQLKITQLPAGAKLTVTCKGRGCAFKSSTTTKGDLTKLFKRRKLSKGAVVSIKIEAPGYKSVTVRFTVQGKKKLPKQRES